jgi:hypothetical protein
VERDSPYALVTLANVVRVLADEDVAQRDLPRRTGVGKETTRVMTGILEKQGRVQIEQAGKTKVARLTSEGRDAFMVAIERLAATEDDWRARYAARFDAVRASLETLVGPGDLATSPLARAIEPPPTGWRAQQRPPEVLPHHPVVSHRGGYPDGS